MRQNCHVSGIESFGIFLGMLGQRPDPFRRTHAGENCIKNIDQEALDHQNNDSPHQKGVDGLTGYVSDIIAADIGTKECIDNQRKVRDGAANDFQGQGRRFENKRDQIEINGWQEKHEQKPLIQAASGPDIE